LDVNIPFYVVTTCIVASSCNQRCRSTVLMRRLMSTAAV
jgi:hypothetical protein